MRVLASPIETGAVTICLPEDVQTEAWNVPRRLFEDRVLEVGRPRASRDAVSEAAARVRGAKRPMIIAGGGVHYSDAISALRTLVDATGIPVAVTQAGVGALPDDHPTCVGAVGVTGTSAANEIARHADWVLLVGTRLSDFTTASKTLFQDEQVRFVSAQIDPFDAAKVGAFALVADARSVLEDLADALAGWRVGAEFAASVRSCRDAWHGTREAILNPPRAGRRGLCQAEVIRIVREGLPANGTIVHAAGGLPGDLHKLWISRDAEDYHSEYGFSCMGYEVAGALGVKLARPEREVVAMVGDGSWLMLHSELVTSLQENAKIIVVLVDNGGYQCIHALQQQCGGRSFGNEFKRRDGAGELTGDRLEIDYAGVARSLGAAAHRAETEAELTAALKAACEEERSVVVHVPVEAGPPVPSYAWWDVPVAEVSATAGVELARERSRQAREGRRFLGP
jgi:3D-(3,5/4)-trihydroxycyclohexane-1,2-dione acylhydrolase (decyclizing)